MFTSSHFKLADAGSNNLLIMMGRFLFSRIGVTADMLSKLHYGISSYPYTVSSPDRRCFERHFKSWKNLQWWYFEGNDLRGYKRFFQRSALETSDYLKDDILDIFCTVGVVVSHTKGPKKYTIPVPGSDLGQSFGALLESGDGADVSFEVDGEIFRAHKLVLATCSPVFKAQLYGPMRDRSTENIKIEDMEASVFKAMLQFIYLDELPDAHELMGTVSTSASTLMAQHLLAVADRYCLDRLQSLCEAKLCEEVSIETVATTLALAEQHHSSQLKSVCLKFAAAPENLGAVMQTEGFEYLQESCGSLVTELLGTVAGVEDECKTSSRKRSNGWVQVADGSEVNGRRVRQRTHYLPLAQ